MILCLPQWLFEIVVGEIVVKSPYKCSPAFTDFSVRPRLFGGFLQLVSHYLSNAGCPQKWRMMLQIMVTLDTTKRA